jgi:hypothetical protein
VTIRHLLRELRDLVIRVVTPKPPNPLPWERRPLPFTGNRAGRGRP